MQHRAKNPLGGFTLVELMVVVMIISVLVAIVLPRMSGRSEQARVTAAETSLSGLGMAIDLYRLDNLAYPGTLDDLIQRPASGTRWQGPYVNRPPVDPWGNRFVYRHPGTHALPYDLLTLGPDGAEGGGDDVGNWSVYEKSG